MAAQDTEAQASNERPFFESWRIWYAVSALVRRAVSTDWTSIASRLRSQRRSTPLYLVATIWLPAKHAKRAKAKADLRSHAVLWLHPEPRHRSGTLAFDAAKGFEFGFERRPISAVFGLFGADLGIEGFAKGVAGARQSEPEQGAAAG